MTQSIIATAVDSYDFQGNRRMAQDSNGRLWVAFRDKANGTYDIKVAYSDDNGATWTIETVKVGVELVESPPGLAVDSNGDIHVVWSERSFTPMGVWLFYRTRTSAGVWAAVVTLLAPALEMQVSVGSDDCLDENNPASFSIVAMTIRAGDTAAGSFDWATGMRFLNVNIPQGATITAAYIRLRRYGTVPGTLPTTIIEGENADNAITFSNIADYDARPRTGASINWTPASWDGWNNSPSIVSIIQEIVNRGGWVPNNAMVIFWSHAPGWGGVNNRLDGYSFERSSAFSPILHIEYSVYNALGFSSPLYPAIAVDNANNIHVVYVDYTTVWRLKYVKKTAGVWGSSSVIATGAAAGDNIEELSLAIDSNNFPHVTYDHEVSGDYRVYYIHETGAGWQAAELVSSAAVGTFPYSQIALDSSDDVHVVWMTYGVGTYPGESQTAYRKRESGVWQAPEYLTDVDNAQGYPCISISSNGIIHVIWMGFGWGANPTEWTIQYKSKSGATWSSQEDLVNEAKFNYPETSLWARCPSSNILPGGFMFIYVSENSVSDLEFYRAVVPAVTTDVATGVT